MSEPAGHLRIVSGDPTPEEVAIVTALMAAAGNDGAPPEPTRRGRWNDPGDQHRRPMRPGPNGWRAAAW